MATRVTHLVAWQVRTRRLCTGGLHPGLVEVVDTARLREGPASDGRACLPVHAGQKRSRMAVASRAFGVGRVGVESRVNRTPS